MVRISTAVVDSIQFSTEKFSVPLWIDLLYLKLLSQQRRFVFLFIVRIMFGLSFSFCAVVFFLSASVHILTVIVIGVGIVAVSCHFFCSVFVSLYYFCCFCCCCCCCVQLGQALTLQALFIRTTLNSN